MARHSPQYVQPLQMLFLSLLNMHLSFKIRRVCVSEGAMPPSCADQLSPRTFCQLGPLVPACSHGRIAENMSGGSCGPRCSDFRTAPPSCVPCFPGPFSTESRRPGARLPVPTCCLALCIPGSQLHVGLLLGSCLTVLLPAPRSFSQSPCGMSV